jgi:hypothetical protein
LSWSEGGRACNAQHEAEQCERQQRYEECGEEEAASHRRYAVTVATAGSAGTYVAP